MKTLLISFALYMLSGINVGYVENLSIPDSLETIDEIKVNALNAIHCNQTKCITSMKEKAKSFEKSMVLYRMGGKWVVERDIKKRINAIEAYSGTDIIIYEGNLRLENVMLSDEAQIVALN